MGFTGWTFVREAGGGAEKLPQINAASRDENGPLGIERQTKTTLREGNRNKKAVQLSVQVYCVRSSHVILCDCKENGSVGRRGRKQQKERDQRLFKQYQGERFDEIGCCCM